MVTSRLESAQRNSIAGAPRRYTHGHGRRRLRARARRRHGPPAPGRRGSARRLGGTGLDGAARRRRARLAAETGWILSVGHVHHGWRGREADRDLAFVSDAARRFGLPFFARRLDASRRGAETRALSGGGARATRATRRCTRSRARPAPRGSRPRTRKTTSPRRTSWPAPDAADSPPSRGPRERRADGIVRPLLSVTRAEILAVLASRGIGSRRDATNGSLRFPRTRARRAIAESRHPASTVARLSADADALARERERVEKEVLRRRDDALGDRPRRERGGRRMARRLPEGGRPSRPRARRDALRPPRPRPDDRPRTRADPRPAGVGRRLPLRGGPAHPIRAAGAPPERLAPAAAPARVDSGARRA